MPDIFVELSESLRERIWQHLLREPHFEEAAFVFADVDESAGGITFRAVDSYLVPPDGFETRSPWFLELADETRAAVIKQAHDLEAALIEFHSHPGQSQAAFSPSDMDGFAEFVPHVRWRLQRRPYAAVVLAKRSFDALVWHGEGSDPKPLTAVVVDGQRQEPTGQTLLSYRNCDHER